jgi:drug/metabolite transporter (DMT)-like permease
VIALAALAAVGWGTADFLGGVSGSRTLVFSVVAASELLGAAMIAPAIAATGAPHWNAHLLLACVAGVGVTVELGVLYYALSIGAAFISAPIGALGSALAVATGLLGGDPLTPAIAAGLICAVIGGGITAAGDSDGVEDDVGGQLGRRRLIAACLVAALGVAAMQITLHAAGKVDPYWAAELEHLTTAASAALAAVAVTRRARRSAGGPGTHRWRPERRQLPLLALIAAAGSGGDVAYAAASTGALSTVSAIASLYPLPTIALGYLIQQRRPARLQAAGIVLALAGAAVLGAASP